MEFSKKIGLSVGEFKKLVSRIQKGERESRIAKKEMVEANLRLVISIAKKYTNRGLQFLELLLEGESGFFKGFDLLFGVGDERVKHGQFFKVVTLLVFAEEAKIGFVGGAPAEEEKLVFSNGCFAEFAGVLALKLVAGGKGKTEGFDQFWS